MKKRVVSNKMVKKNLELSAGSGAFVKKSVPVLDSAQHTIQGQSASWAPMWAKQMGQGGGLFVVATPIGHCEDITLRALETLRQVDGILCEDTRTTAILLHHYGISRPCYSYHAHNERQKLNGIIHRLRQGDQLALVSDRGTPLISDPGLLLVQKCHDEGIPVHVIGGVSAAMHAVVWSGLHKGSFYFQGFMPARKTKEHWNFLATLPVAMVFFVAPHDLWAFIQDALAVLGPRSACLMRELTKKFEERIAMPLDQLAHWVAASPHLGECVVVIQGQPVIARKAQSKYTKDDPVLYEEDCS